MLHLPLILNLRPKLMLLNLIQNQRFLILLVICQRLIAIIAANMDIFLAIVAYHVKTRKFFKPTFLVPIVIARGEIQMDERQNKVQV